jgi:LmbE family N-acetylglucosaminyl deacetylase
VTVSIDLATPARVLAIGAHPDDIEFGSGATLAKWAESGAEVHLCVLTDGSKGTWDGDANLTALVARREQEQRDAARELGAAGVEMLGFVDGELEDTPNARAAVCNVIRRVQPEVVIGHDPWRTYRVHPDHHNAGLLTVAGIVAARDPHFFPEQTDPPHRPTALLCFEAGRVDHVERVHDHIDHKIRALLAHRSQWRSTMDIGEDGRHTPESFAQARHAIARAAGLRAGLRAAEAFARLDDL